LNERSLTAWPPGNPKSSSCDPVEKKIDLTDPHCQICERVAYILGRDYDWSTPPKVEGIDDAAVKSD